MGSQLDNALQHDLPPACTCKAAWPYFSLTAFFTSAVLTAALQRFALLYFNEYRNVTAMVKLFFEPTDATKAAPMDRRRRRSRKARKPLAIRFENWAPADVDRDACGPSANS